MAILLKAAGQLAATETTKKLLKQREYWLILISLIKLMLTIKKKINKFRCGFMFTATVFHFTLNSCPAANLRGSLLPGLRAKNRGWYDKPYQKGTLMPF